MSVCNGEAAATCRRREGPGRGVSGFSMHTVPVALHVRLRHQRDDEAAVTDVIACGGDTDTEAAIVLKIEGRIVGGGVGEAGIPGAWWADPRNGP